MYRPKWKWGEYVGMKIVFPSFFFFFFYLFFYNEFIANNNLSRKPF